MSTAAPEFLSEKGPSSSSLHLEYQWPALHLPAHQGPLVIPAVALHRHQRTTWTRHQRPLLLPSATDEMETDEEADLLASPGNNSSDSDDGFQHV